MRCNNERAIIGLPIYLLVALIVTTTILAIFTLSIMNTTQESQIYQLNHEIDKIITQATNMFEYADSGSTVTIPVVFPSSMRYLVFGDLPRNGIDIPDNLTLYENTSNNYYFVMNDGSVFTYHSNARFSGKNETTFAIFHPGTYNIVLELTQYRGKTYVKVYK